MYIPFIKNRICDKNCEDEQIYFDTDKYKIMGRYCQFAIKNCVNCVINKLSKCFLCTCLKCNLSVNETKYYPMGDGICYPCGGTSSYILKELYPNICECPSWNHSHFIWDQWRRCDQNSGSKVASICFLTFRIRNYLTIQNDLFSKVIKTKNSIDINEMITKKRQIIGYLLLMKKREITKQEKVERQLRRQSFENFVTNRQLSNKKPIQNIPNKRTTYKCRNFRKSHR